MEHLLEVKKLHVAFGGLVALDLEEFYLRDRELRVIIGPNGAGKSTFMDLLCGKTEANRGEVMFNGKEIMGKKEVQIAQMGIGRKFQKPSVFNSLTVFDNMLLSAKMPKGIFATMFFRMNQEVEDKIHAVAKKIGLSQVLQKPAGALSHGQKQWLEIGIVMLQDPKLMLIDEPAAGMSDEETKKTGELLIQLAESHSVIVIEHDMNFVKQIALDLVTVFVRGKLLMQGKFDEVRNDDRVIDSYLGRTNAKLED